MIQEIFYLVVLLKFVMLFFFYDMVKFKNIFVKEDLIEIFVICRDFLLIRYRRKMFVIFNDNYLQFCLLYFLVICDNIIVVNILIENGVDLF